MDRTIENIYVSFGREFYETIKKIDKIINEIRLRCSKPVVIYISGKPFLIDKNGCITGLENYDSTIKNYLTADFNTLKKAFERLCDFSVYKHQININNGFITVLGGHRIGICGTAVAAQFGIKNVTEITSVNVRLAHEYIGCSDELLRRVSVDDGVLLCGVPSCGKTTLLRDISRNLSVNYCEKVSVIDERSELFSVVNGQAVFESGFCDIYSCYPKREGIFQAIRTMSPDYIVCDELTGSDVDSVIQTVNYGVKIISTVHCDCLENALKNSSIVNLLKTNAFGKIVFLKKREFGKISKIYNVGDILPI